MIKGKSPEYKKAVSVEQIVNGIRFTPMVFGAATKDNKRFVPDEVWESVEEVEETLEYLIAQYGS